MKRNGLTLAFCLWFLLAGCATQPTLSTTPTLVEHTATPAPQPTATLQPTVVPYTPTDGPYLAYFRESDGKRELVLMSPDGKAYKTISLPPEIANLSSGDPVELRLLSPDGNWLAFYTGSAGNWPGQAAPEKFDLALNLMNIKTGETYPVAHLLSKDYPKNFEAAAKQLGRSDVTAESLQFAFVAGIKQSIAWSPDGRYLAFAGQMEGVSSDLYLYDTRYGTIKRLSSGPQEMQWIDWSPDGQWIVHSSVYNVGEGMSFDIYVSNLDGSDVRYLSTTSIGKADDWLNPHMFFQHNSENGPGDFELQVIDIRTGKTTKVWDGAFMSYAFDKAKNQVLVFAITPRWPYNGDDPNFISGNYLIDLNTLSKTFIDPENGQHAYLKINPFGLGERMFSLMGSSSDTISFLTTNGKLMETKFSGMEISVSPNKNYWFILSDEELKIFTPDDQLVQKIHHPNPADKSYSILWRPDESGLFVIAEREIYALDLHSENFMLVENNLMETFGPSNYKWVGEK